MVTYKIRQSSLGLFAVILFTVVFADVGIFFFLLHNLKHQIAYVLSFAILLPSMLYIPQMVSSADTEITLTDKGIEHKWIKQILFQQKNDLSILWEEISDYVFEPHSQFDQFKLHLKDGTTFRIFHNHDHDKDEFRIFIQD